MAAPRFLNIQRFTITAAPNELLEIDVKYAIKPFGYIETRKISLPDYLFSTMTVRESGVTKQSKTTIVSDKVKRLSGL